MEQKYRLAIKYNNFGANGCCPICGGGTDPSIPLALFLQDSFADVFDQCGKKYAPELHALLGIFEALPDNPEKSMGEAQVEALKDLYKFLVTVDKHGIKMHHWPGRSTLNEDEGNQSLIWR